VSVVLAILGKFLWVSAVIGAIFWVAAAFGVAWKYRPRTQSQELLDWQLEAEKWAEVCEEAEQNFEVAQAEIKRLKEEINGVRFSVSTSAKQNDVLRKTLESIQDHLEGVGFHTDGTVDVLTAIVSQVQVMCRGYMLLRGNVGKAPEPQYYPLDLRDGYLEKYTAVTPLGDVVAHS
jgi:septal ring factor EnvC (AmiA/AmiB activator)